VSVAAAPRHASTKAADDERSKPPLAPAPWHIPVGITLPVVPGKGLGPIRFGARLDTVERLMAVPCEEKRQDSPHLLVCRYSAQAVEFYLENGVVTRMRAHRVGRVMREQPKLEFGIFNGRFEEGVSLGMVPAAVEQMLGKPTAVRKIDPPNSYGTVEIHDYPLYSLEFDQPAPGKQVVLGGIDLHAPERGKAKRPLRSASAVK
jgi:hypothetical protein